MFKELSWGRELQDIWIRLFNGNKYLYPYSSYEYAQICRKCFRWQTHRWFDKTRIFYYKNEETGAEIIAPLTWHKENIYIYGDWETARLLDFVYSENVANEDFEQLFYGLRDVGGIKKLNLNRLHDDSLLRRYIEQQKTFRWREDNNRVCVKIDFKDGYDVYKKRIKKAQRQNLRTAYNRLSREKKAVVFYELNENYVKNIRKIQETLSLYIDRQNEKYGGKYIGIRKLKFKHFNPVWQAIIKLQCGRIFNICCENKIIAVMMGLVCNDGKILIPMLAIDSKYSSYSPGKVLIDQAISYFCGSSTSVQCLDLSNGDEPYKLDMGGTKYMSHDYELELVQ